MNKFLSRPGATAGLIGAVALAQLVGASLIASANSSAVFVGGRELHWGCAFRQHFGIPCPACGLTRSVLMTLHGQLTEALQMNPAGPLLVIGALLFIAATFFFMRYQQQSPARHQAERLQRRLLVGASAYGGVVVAVALLHWVHVAFVR